MPSLKTEILQLPAVRGLAQFSDIDTLLVGDGCSIFGQFSQGLTELAAAV
ncbi:MAG: hypothetical protein F6J93_02545 [Oscillatoria sp. SIO1A7]|nr:hypothetical protein [Oscillatoria sp. SIO1A7]